MNITKTFFTQLASILKNEILFLPPDELKAIGPDVEAFFSWLAQNPTAPGNPVVFLPKLAVLKTEVLAAQSTVATELVQSFATDMANLFKTLNAEASSPAPVQSSPVSSEKPV